MTLKEKIFHHRREAIYLRGNEVVSINEMTWSQLFRSELLRIVIGRNPVMFNMTVHLACTDMTKAFESSDKSKVGLVEGNTLIRGPTAPLMTD